MSNIRKSFNFRNGVQVDETNFIVNSNGLVGIGTSIPSEALDVKGNVLIEGTLIAGAILSDNLNVVNTSIDSLSIGIVSISSGIITASTGIVTYYGDGGQLLNLPTSQWVDVDPGFGYTSIYAAGNVGVGTTYPDYTFQVGGTPGIKEGFGVDEVGNVYFTGIITAGSTAIIEEDLIVLGIGSFGDYITSPNYLSVGSGATIGGGLVVGGGATIANSIGVGGSVIVSQSSSFENNLNIGGDLSVGDDIILGGDITLPGNVTSGGIGTFQTLYSNSDVYFKGNLNFTDGQITWNGGYISEIDTKIYGSLGIGGGTTIGSFLTVGGNASLGFNLGVGNNLTVGTSGTFGRDLFVSGIATVTQGLTVNARSVINGFDIGGILGNRLSFNNPGDLEIDSLSGTVLINDDLVVTGFTSVSLGSTIRNIRVAVSGENIINTTSGDLILDSADGLIQVNKQLNAINGVLAENNIGIATLNFNTINTISGDLRLDSFTGIVGINSNLSVTGNAIIKNIKLGIVDENTIDTTSGDLKLSSSTGNILVDNYLIVGSAATVGVIQFGVLDSNTIDTSAGDLILSAVTGLVKINNLEVSGITSFIGGTTLTGGITLDGNLRIGVTNNDIIDTTFSDLILDSFTNLVRVDSDLNVSGLSTFIGEIDSSTIKSSSGITIANDLRLGVTNFSTIDTISGNLVLDSFTKRVNINSDLNVSGISTFNSLVDINNDLIVQNYIKVGVNSLTTLTGNLNLRSATDQTILNGTLSITENLLVGSNGDVSGILTVKDFIVTENSSFLGISTFLSIFPALPSTGTIGSESNRILNSYFENTYSNNGYITNLYSTESYIGNITVGVENSSKIESTTEDLILNSLNGNIKIPNSLELTSEISEDNNIILNPDNKFIGIGTYLSEYDFEIKSTSNKVLRIGDSLYDFDTNSSETGNIGITTTIITGINTSNLSIGSQIRPIENIIDDETIIIGFTDTPSQIEIDTQTLNESEIIGQSLDFGFFRSFEGYGFSIGYESSSTPYIAIGLGTVGLGKSIGYISHSDESFSFTNIDYNDFIFSLDNSNEILPTLETVENVVSYAGTIGITTTIITGIQTTNLEIGFGVAEISGILTTGVTIVGFADEEEKIEISTQTENTNIITEQLFDFTRQLVGYANTGSFRWIHGRTDQVLMTLSYDGVLSINNQLQVGSLSVNEDGVSTGFLESNNLLISSSVGIATTLSTCIADFSAPEITSFSDTISQKFMLPPIITDSQRIGLSTAAGAMIFNSTANKHQAYDGTTWHDLY
jgi:hypothetical protein